MFLSFAFPLSPAFAASALSGLAEFPLRTAAGVREVPLTTSEDPGGPGPRPTLPHPRTAVAWRRSCFSKSACHAARLSPLVAAHNEENKRPAYPRLGHVPWNSREVGASSARTGDGKAWLLLETSLRPRAGKRQGQSEGKVVDQVFSEVFALLLHQPLSASPRYSAARRSA